MNSWFFRIFILFFKFYIPYFFIIVKALLSITVILDFAICLLNLNIRFILQRNWSIFTY